MWLQVLSRPSTKAASSPAISGAGRLVFGQELDSMEGLFSVTQSFEGDMTDVMIMDGLITIDDAQQYISCQQMKLNIKTLYSFQHDLDMFKSNGSTQIGEIPTREICNATNSYLLMYPVTIMYDEARQFCATFNGSLLVPENEFENNIIFYRFKKFTLDGEKCIGSSATAFWYGIKGNLSDGLWYKTEDGVPLQWHRMTKNWDEVSVGRQCVAAGGVNYPLEWFASACTITACPICKFYKHSAINIKGLCSDSRFETHLTLNTMKDGFWSFEGTYRTSIMYNGSHWVMKNRDDFRILGTLLHGDYKYLPLGNRLWQFVGDTCSETVNKI